MLNTLPNRPRVTIIWEEPDLPESSSSPTALPSDDPYAVPGVGPNLSPATLISYGPYLGVPPFEAEQARLWLHTAQITELEAQPNGMTAAVIAAGDCLTSRMPRYAATTATSGAGAIAESGWSSTSSPAPRSMPRSVAYSLP